MFNLQLHTIRAFLISVSSVSYVSYIYVFFLFSFLLYLRCDGGLAEKMGAP